MQQSWNNRDQSPDRKRCHFNFCKHQIHSNVYMTYVMQLLHTLGKTEGRHNQAKDKPDKGQRTEMMSSINLNASEVDIMQKSYTRYTHHINIIQHIYITCAAFPD